MSTWQTPSLSGVPERSGRDGPPRGAVREHVLDVAQELIDAYGLTVSLGHLNFDEIIIKAEVSRTTAYRVWPRKERFLEDLLRRLADTCSPCYGTLDHEAAEVALKVLRSHVDELRTAAGRRMVIVEMCRVTSEHSFERMLSSPRWMTYVGIIATMRSLGDEELARDLRQRMRKVEDEAAAHSAAIYQHAASLTGYRLREFPGDYTAFAHIGAAMTEGMLLLSDIRPTIPASLGNIDPFGTGHSVKWSLPGIGYTSALMSLLEPDPEFNLEKTHALLNRTGTEDTDSTVAD